MPKDGGHAVIKELDVSLQICLIVPVFDTFQHRLETLVDRNSGKAISERAVSLGFQLVHSGFFTVYHMRIYFYDLSGRCLSWPFPLLRHRLTPAIFRAITWRAIAWRAIPGQRFLFHPGRHQG